MKNLLTKILFIALLFSATIRAGVQASFLAVVPEVEAAVSEGEMEAIVVVGMQIFQIAGVTAEIVGEKIAEAGAEMIKIVAIKAVTQAAAEVAVAVGAVAITAGAVAGVVVGGGVAAAAVVVDKVVAEAAKVTVAVAGKIIEVIKKQR